MKVSIITVCYNSQKYIGSTIESVLNLSYPNIEYIVVDGGSKDQTMNIINKYKPLFGERMMCISENDKGIYDAMNKGIRMATGDIVGIINSDDFYHRTDIIEKIVDAFSDSSVCAIYGDVRFVNPLDLDKTVRYYSSRFFSPRLFRLGFMPAHPTFFTYKSFFDKFGYYKTDYKICADFDLLLRFIYVNKIKVKYVSVDMVTMRTGGVSTNGLKSHIQIMKEHLRCLKENHVKSNVILLSMRYFYKITEYFKLNIYL